MSTPSTLVCSNKIEPVGKLQSVAIAERIRHRRECGTNLVIKKETIRIDDSNLTDVVWTDDWVKSRPKVEFQLFPAYGGHQSSVRPSTICVPSVPANLSRALLMESRTTMDHLAPSTINVRMSAVRKLVGEARRNGMIGAKRQQI
jgi:hypothetical protein